MPAAGALRSTADDMLRYLSAQLNPDDTELAEAIRMTHVLRDDPKLTIGLGWMRLDKPHRLWWHNGGTGGYRSFAGFRPGPARRRRRALEPVPQRRPRGAARAPLPGLTTEGRWRPFASVGDMFAVYADAFSSDDPLSGLVVGERPDPTPPEGWTTVTVKAASLNHHDLWSLRGVGLKQESLPMILGCDAAGLDEDGNEVVVHAVISDPDWSGDETFDPKRSLLSERHQGTFADKVVVPRANVIPKPASMSFEEAACLPTAWLTAYRMLFTQGGLRPATPCSCRAPAGESRPP